VFVSDEGPPHQLTHAGLRLDALRATDDTPVVPAPERDLTLARRQYFLDAGGNPVIMVHFAPESQATEATTRGVYMNAATQELFKNFQGSRN
jgi:hypothetical protein